MSHAPDTLTLVADIGGTNTRVALAEGTQLLSETVTRYRNADHAGLHEVLTAFLGANGNPDCAGACAAAAGPVFDGVAELTNLDWTIDRAVLAEAAQAERSAVLNDLQAQGHALGFIAGESLFNLLPGQPGGERAAKLVVNVGTGFNAVSVYDPAGGRLVPPGEGGHVTMPVRDAADLRLAKFVEAEHGFASVEDVLSGRGLAHIYAWRASEAGSEARPSPAEVMARRDSDPLAAQAVADFARLLGTVAGDLALHHLPFGGVYLIGGVARHVRPHLGEGFAAAFRDKGRFSEFMDQFAVWSIEDDYAALKGCACYLAGV